MTLTPAYGRDYNSAKEVLQDWNKGKDFIVADMFSPYDGKSINKQDAEREDTGFGVMIRYKNLTRITAISLNK